MCALNIGCPHLVNKWEQSENIPQRQGKIRIAFYFTLAYPHVLHIRLYGKIRCGKVCGNCGKPNKEIGTISLFNKILLKG